MLAADYGRGTFDLAGGYASGLARGAQIRVDVNGRNSGIIKLPYADGEVFKHNQLFLPLGMMRPGVNRVEVYAETPRAEDASCAATSAKRFLFLDKSELRLPTLARVQRLPDLALATAGALPFTEGHAHLVVPKPDRDTIGAALSLTARAAVAAGRVVPFSFSTKMPTGSDGSTLVVSPARALDPGTMMRVGARSRCRRTSLARCRRVETRHRCRRCGAVQSRWWLSQHERAAGLPCRIADRVERSRSRRMKPRDIGRSPPSPRRATTFSIKPPSRRRHQAGVIVSALGSRLHTSGSAPPTARRRTLASMPMPPCCWRRASRAATAM